MIKNTGFLYHKATTNALFQFNRSIICCSGETMDNAGSSKLLTLMYKHQIDLIGFLKDLPYHFS